MTASPAPVAVRAHADAVPATDALPTPAPGALRSRPIRPLRQLLLRVLLALPPLLLLTALTAVYLAPYRTLERLRSATAQRDSALIARDIDEPALRASLRSALAERMVARNTGAGRDTLFSAAASGVAASFVGSAVDRMLSAEGLALLFEGRADAPAAAPTAGAPTAGAPTAASAAPSTAAPAAAVPDIDRGYDDFNQFSAIVRHPDQPRRAVTLIFQRHHIFWWRLSAVRLPE